MSARITLATARRVAEQLRGDRRTLAMIMVVPPALVALFKFVYENQPESFFTVLNIAMLVIVVQGLVMYPPRLSSGRRPAAAPAPLPA